MSDIGGDVSTIVTRMASDFSRETAKMTNESIKQMLIFLINKAREQGDKPGEKSLKKLLSSKDEIKLFDLDKSRLKEFAEKAKRYQIAYAVVEDEGRHSVFYKQSDEVRVKSIIENLINKEMTPTDRIDKQPERALPYQVVGESSIRVPNAVLDMNIEFHRELAAKEGINIGDIQMDNARLENEKAARESADAPNNDKTKYDVVGDSQIKVNDAVLDMDVGFQRELAEREGVDTSSFTDPQKNMADERYLQAVDLARQSGEIAIPKLQSEFNVGYGEARNLIDRMESKGLVSQYDGSQPQIYIGGQGREAAEIQAETQKEAPDTIPAFLKQRGERQEASQLEAEQQAPEQLTPYERLEGNKIKVPHVTLDMNNPQHRELAESYGIKVNEIDFKRETSDLAIEKEEVKGRESLTERLGATGKGPVQDDKASMVRDMLHRVNTRMSLDERRRQIRPLIEAQREAAPTKNKNREKGGR
ncbi:DNA translocase FtsK [Paenibacillus sp. FSL M7-0802]|uniref:DNA translocase FtsK n=1 Tax=Paenibacillus sp. FSL M7-0802 TaxID=2921536 RepID=UPI0030F9DC8D